MPTPANQRDLFAEMYVAGVLADSGWRIYFPYRDDGFDFVISKKVAGTMLVRPVQVKGKYPESEKAKRPAYGFDGQLTQTHPDMVLVIPFFSIGTSKTAPTCTAYALWNEVRARSNGEVFCLPANLVGGVVSPRRDFRHLFDEEGLARLERPMPPKKAVHNSEHDS